MLKNQKGITLIALIITIIVMLILVAVTINIAVNGGIFSKANDAAMKTEKRAILEQIIALSEWDDNGKINIAGTVDNVEQEFEEVTVTESTTQAIVTITGKHGKYNYKITTTEITIIEGSEPEPEPEAYYFTFNMLNEIQSKTLTYQVLDETSGASMSMASINKEEFWNKVGFDLSGTYGVSGEMQKINADKSIIPSDTGAFAEYYDGAGTVSSDNLFIFIEGDDQVFMYLIDNPGEEIDFGEPTNVRGIVSEEGTEAEGLLSWEEFLATYGDIKFYFEGTKKVDLSTLSDLEKLKLYFVDNILFSFTDDSGLMNTTDGTFKNTTTILGEIPLNCKGVFGLYEKLTVEYNNKYYIAYFEGEAPSYICTDVKETTLTVDQITNENLGKYVEYDSDGDGTTEDWIILYNDEANGIQLLSATVSSESYALQGFDGYNNAVQILNTACDGLVTETVYKASVRTIGSNPASTKDNPLDGEDVADGTLKPVNENYVSDFIRMSAIEDKLDTTYWFAGRQEPYYTSSGDTDYWIAFGSFNTDWGVSTFSNGDTSIVSQNSDNSYTEHSVSKRVRSVVTLKSGVTINTEGHTGNADDPYTLQ